MPSADITSKIGSESLLILDCCYEIHKYAEGVYQDLAAVHRSSGEISQLWGLFAVDKCNHADTFKMAYRLKGGGIRRIHGTETIVRGILSKMRSIPKVDRNKPPSLVHALRFSIKMEELLSNVHFFHMVEFIDARGSSLLTSKLKSSSAILHILTEEYLNLTMTENETF